MTYEDSIKNYFTAYSKFLSVDLSVSLLDKKDKYFGRNITLIVLFQDLLILLLGTKEIEGTDVENDRKILFNKLNLILQPYLEKNAEHLCTLKHGNIAQTLSGNSFYFDKLNDTFNTELLNNYYMSYKDFVSYSSKVKMDEDVRKKFELYNSDNIILVQSILEFNNALSHIVASLYNNDNDALNNIGKATSHLYRGTLDHYKMLIRLVFMDSEKSIKTEIMDDFKELRHKEFEYLGLKVQDKDIDCDGKPVSILSCYKEMFSRMMMNVA